MIRSHLFRLSLMIGLIAGLCGCASEELAQLQTDVGDLHSRLYQMQRSSERQTTTTKDSMQRVSQEISGAFDELRFSQSSLEEKINQLSARLLTVEQGLESLQTRAAQLENRMDQSTGALRQDLARQGQEHQAALRKSEADLADLRRSLTALQQQQKDDSAALNDAIRRVNDNLAKRVNSLDSEVQSVYQEILTELGTTETAGGYSGDVYIVEAGDTLSGIAQAVGVSASALQEANEITDPNRLRVGQRLKVPK